MNLYIAAPLFTEAERAFNLVLARALEGNGHEVYLPQRDGPAPESPGRTVTIFRGNLAALAKSDAVIAVCDGPQVDDGTAWEIGYAYGRSIQIYGLRTDTRIVAAAGRTNQPDGARVVERALADDRAASPYAALCGAARAGKVPRSMSSKDEQIRK